MDNSKLNQTELSMDSLVGYTSVNVYTGRLLYNYLDIDYGNGSNNLTVSHIYNSHFELPNEDSTNMGKHWKLDIQEYVYHEPEINVYQYFDGLGMIHNFKYLKNNEYYDESGTGLKLVIDNNNNSIVIKNLFNLRMTFKNNKITNKTIGDKTYIYEYDTDGMLVNYYETSNLSNSIQFEYNPDKLLKKMYASTTDVRNYYYLGTNKLQFISKSNSRDVIFNYDKEQLNIIYDNISKQGFVATYIDERILKLETGLISKSQFSKEYYSNYIGDDLYLGDDVYLGEKETKEFLTFDLSYKYQKNEFTYEDKYTKVLNEDAITNVYYFNNEGFTTTIFEENYSFGAYNYLTNVEPCGLMVKLDGTEESRTINMNKIVTNNLRNGINKNKMLYLEEEVASYEFKNNNYLCTFWINLLNKNGGNKVGVEITFNDGSVCTYEQLFDNELINSWQQITIPITNVKNKVLQDIKVKFQLGTLSDEVKISMLNLFPNNNSKLKLKGELTNETGITSVDVDLKDINSIYYETEISSITKNINIKNYLTEKDLLMTYLNTYNNRYLDENQNVILPGYRCNYLNNLKQCIYSKELKFIRNSNEGIISLNMLEMGSNEKYYKLPFYTLTDSDYYEFIKQTYIYTNKILPGYDEGIECLCYENITKVKSNPNISHINYEYHDLEGRLIYKKTPYYKDGEEIPTFKEEVIIYDGNNVEKYFKAEENGDYSLSTYECLYNYSEYGNYSTEKSGGLIITNNYDSKNSMLKYSESYYNLNNVLKHSYKYNNNLEVTDISISKNNNILTNVILTNDETKKGVTRIEDENYKYNYEYDSIYGYLKKVTDKNNNVLFEQSINPNTKLYTRNYNGKQIVEKYNKYGFPEYYQANGLKAEYSYYNIRGSKKNSKVQEIKIGDKEKHTFSYQDNSLLKNHTQRKKCDRIVEGINTTVIDVVEGIDESAEDKAFRYVNYELNSMTDVRNEHTPTFVYRYDLKNTDNNKISDKITNSGTEIFNENIVGKGNVKILTNYQYDVKDRIKEKNIAARVEDTVTNNIKTGYIKNEFSYYPTTSFPLMNKTCILENNQERLINQTDYVFTSGNLSEITKTDNIPHNNGYTDRVCKISYEYDDHNRISKEINERNDIERLYQYNSFGNLSAIITTEQNPTKTETKQFIYSENDSNKLSQIKLDEQVLYDEIEYDERGKLIGYTQNNYSCLLEYDAHNNLILYKKQNNENSQSIEEVRYEYDINGRRIKKVVSNGPTIEYFYDGNRLLWETRYFEEYENNNPITTTMKIAYFYDKDGVIGFSVLDDRLSNTNTYHKHKYYHYIKDVLGNINGITDGENNIVIYDYDAWGNRTYECAYYNEEIAVINPFGYRGYYYDVETNLFLVSSRYYSPELCRWISPDDIEYLDPESVNGLNLYCYCFNNPIMYIDPDGHSPKWWQWALFGVGVALVAVAAGMAIIGTGGVAAFGAGALVGSLAVGAGGAIVGGAIGYAVDGVDGILGGALAGFGIGAIVGFAVGGTIGYYNSLVKVDIRKFTEYVLDPTNSKGKDVIFNNLGYNQTNAQSLARLYKRQGVKNLIRRSYKLGKLDTYGQRINMAIKIGDKVLNSAWMKVGKGIRLVSPFVGFL